MPSALVPLANITLSGSQTTVTFSSISGAYRDLMLIMTPITGDGLATIMRINSDTGNNYNNVRMMGNGSSAISNADSNQGSIFTQYYGTPSGTNAALQIIHFLDYSATDKHKTIITANNEAANAVERFCSRWANTAAITTITLSVQTLTFKSGSTFALYGVSS